jgi:predicted dehydrogenase
MTKLRYASIGCGFWANFQIPGWLEHDGVECVAVYNRTASKGEALAKKFGIPHAYSDPAALFANEKLDFVDIITDVDTHLKFATLAAERGINVVCQKPLAPNYRDAKALVEVCRKHGVKLFVNENFRWQAPLRKLKQIVDSGTIGKVFKARVTFCSAFPVFENQPFLKHLDQFIITDVGSHVLDVCRFLLGEAKTLQCLISTVNPTIKGEDVANIFMKMESGAHCYAEMSYASVLEKELFPQTLVLLEGEKGSVKLDADYEIRVTTRQGTTKETVKPKLYKWIDPEYAVIHSSIVDTQGNILQGLRGGHAETNGDDNFKTVQLVWASYESAATGKIIDLKQF